MTLHPQSMPSTPYATALAHYTHRREWRWEFKAHCTSASNTGCRFGCFVLPDPTIIDGITSEMVWSAITNGLGALIDSVGVSSKTKTMSVQSATNILSNALPGPGESHLGYAIGTLILYLLDTPIGITTTDKVRLVVLCRCQYTPHNPVPGFGLFESKILQSPRIPPGPPDWQMLVSYAFVDKDNDPPMSDFNTTSGSQYIGWIQSHTGNIPLAGGYYFIFAGAGGTAPVINENVGTTGRKSNVTIKGNPCSGRVYICNSDFPPWQNNRGVMLTPRYFATIKGFFTHHVYMVGFVSETQASNQVDGAFTLIPPGAELCIRYNQSPFWSNFHPQTSTKELQLNFHTAYTSKYSAEIYRTTVPVSAASYMYDQNDGPSTSGTQEQLAAAALEPSAPPYDSDWDEESEEEEEAKVPLPSDRPYGGLTPDELAEAYARAVQLVDDLEEETRNRAQTHSVDQSTQATGSWWDLLKTAITRRRKYMA